MLDLYMIRILKIKYWSAIALDFEIEVSYVLKSGQKMMLSEAGQFCCVWLEAAKHMISIAQNNVSSHIRKPTICICDFQNNCTADQSLCFCSLESTMSLLL